MEINQLFYLTKSNLAKGRGGRREEEGERRKGAEEGEEGGRGGEGRGGEGRRVLNLKFKWRS